LDYCGEFLSYPSENCRGLVRLGQLFEVLDSELHSFAASDVGIVRRLRVICDVVECSECGTKPSLLLVGIGASASVHGGKICVVGPTNPSRQMPRSFLRDFEFSVTPYGVHEE